ncbi:SH3 and PX domain-containing protein 2A-like [Liolophura sinensis]|uniref:SH3 and PX domain-containing protein 2A-like n=1 Tax=Liolophura sinensis TaxID=3198878 RepID=UPI003159299A
MGRRSIATVKVTDVEKRRSPSKHYVYVICVTWSDGTTSTIYRRYSRFFDFQNELLDKFPNQAGKGDPNKRIIPFLPGKKFLGRSHIREVAEKRLKPINEYCESLIKLPSEIAESDEVLEFFEVEPEDVEPIKKRHVSKKPKGNKISGPKLLEQYVAIADYKPEGKGEIALRQGVSVEVAEKTETGWWFVTAEDEHGWVPSTYLQRTDGQADQGIETPEPGQEEEYICTTAFKGDGPDEISLEIGAIVLIMEKNLQGWWKVRFNRQEGYVPATYLSKINPDKARGVQHEGKHLSQGVQVVSSLSEVSEYFKPSTKKASFKHPPPRTNSLPKGSGLITPSVIRVKEYVTIDAFSDTMGDGISFSAGESVKVLEKSPSGWWYVEIGEQEGWAPAAYIQQLPDTPAVSEEGTAVIESVTMKKDEFDEESDSDFSQEESGPHPSNEAALQSSLVSKLGNKTKGKSRPSVTPPPPPTKPGSQKGAHATIAKPGVMGAKAPATPAKPETPPKLNSTGSSSHGQASIMRPKPPANKPSSQRSSTEDEWDNVPSPTLKVNDLANALKAKFEQSGNGSDRFRKSKPPPPSKPNNFRISKAVPPSESGVFTPSKPDPPCKPDPPAVTLQKQQYRVSSTFVAENTGEINLRQGDRVSVVQTDDSGWWLVESEGVEGWAPASYLDSVDDVSPLTSPSMDKHASIQSNSLMDEISSKFGARLKPVQKSSPSSDNCRNGGVSSSPLLPPGKNPSPGSLPALPVKPKSGAASKGRLPPVPPQKPS